MRLLTLLALLLVPGALAQVPDTTSAWRYLPLAVGNAWEYRDARTECNIIGQCETETIGYTRWTVAGEAVVADTAYVVVRDAQYGPGGSVLVGEADRLVRFDTTAARVVELVGTERVGTRRASSCRSAAVPPGGHEVGWPLREVACRLDGDFGSEAVCADGTDFVPYVAGGHDESYYLAGGLTTVTLKTFGAEVYGADFVAGVGLAFYGYGCNGGGSTTLTWALVDGQQVGAAVVGAQGSAPASAVQIQSFPNPSRGGAIVVLTVPEAAEVRVELFDALGRRVAVLHDGALAAGPSRLALPALAPGAYVVRVARGDALSSAVVRVVR